MCLKCVLCIDYFVVKYVIIIRQNMIPGSYE